MFVPFFFYYYLLLLSFVTPTGLKYLSFNGIYYHITLEKLTTLNKNVYKYDTYLYIILIDFYDTQNRF